MLKLEARPEPSRAMSIASPLIALAITVVIGTCLFLILGKDPMRGLAVFFVEPVKSVYALTELAVKATPLLLIALGLAVCFRSNVWNIGAEGQFIVGREIDAQPKLLVVSQPTWGVDVGAAAQIRGELLALRDNGCAVLVVSEELDELFEICDRLIVIAQGRVSPGVATAAATVEQIGEWMSGLWSRDFAASHAPA